MTRYITEECKQCDAWIEPYGCTEHKCPIYQDYEDEEYDNETEWEDE